MVTFPMAPLTLMDSPRLPRTESEPMEEAISEVGTMASVLGSVVVPPSSPDTAILPSDPPMVSSPIMSMLPESAPMGPSLLRAPTGSGACAALCLARENRTEVWLLAPEMETEVTPMPDPPTSWPPPFAVVAARSDPTKLMVAVPGPLREKMSEFPSASTN